MNNIDVSDEGVQVKHFAYDPALQPKNELWSANWIWIDNTIYPEYQESFNTLFCNCKEKYNFAVSRFRKNFRLTNKIKSVDVWISADVKYRLYINGRLAGRGPAVVGGDLGNKDSLGYWFYDTRNYTELFHYGTNSVCAEVALLPSVQADFSSGHGGFIFEALVIYENGTSETLKSTNNWKAIKADSYVKVGITDLSRETPGWLESGFDDSQWPFAQNVSDPGRWNLISAEIPELISQRILPYRVRTPFTELGDRLQNGESLTNEHANSHACVLPGAPFTFWLSFKKTLSGYVYFKIKGTSGAKIDIETQEIIGKSDCHEAIELKNGINEFESFHLRSVQHLKITFSNIAEPVEIFELGVNFTSYPVEYKGKMESSDKGLEQVYNTIRWTNQLCMQSYHMDSPIHQEPLGCTGDYLIESLINYYTFGDKWLTRLDIVRTAHLIDRKNGFMFHTSYSLLWIQMLVDYYDYTGENELLEKCFHSVLILLERFKTYTDASGLIVNPPNYMFMDWVQEGRFNLHHPPKCIGQAYLNAFYYKALKNAAKIAEIIDNRSSEHLLSLAAQVKEIFQKTFWDIKRQLYCDGVNGNVSTIPNEWLPADADGMHFSQHTNSLAVLYDIAPKDMQKDLMHRVFRDKTLTQAQPYFLHFVLDAAEHAGVFTEYGLEQIKRWEQLLRENPTSLKEVWNGFDCDYSHAWGGTPAYQIPSKFAGVYPCEPGYKVIGIKPNFVNLNWIYVEVPTPKGIVMVSWSKSGAGIKLNIKIPKVSKAKITLPQSLTNHLIQINGREIRRSENSVLNSENLLFMDKDDFVEVEVNGGEYKIQLE